jgi:spore maturation protein CgeB
MAIMQPMLPLICDLPKLPVWVACLVTDWKPNLKDFFDPETEIVSYKNVDEAAEKIKYLLQNDHERNSIAAAGQKRTLQNYTMKIRLQQLIPNIIKHL